MLNAQEIFKKCSLSMRLRIFTNLHIKEALLCVLHNSISEPQVKAIPFDSMALYTFLQNHKNKIQKSPHIKAHQKSFLLPTNCQSVDSTSMDISLIRYLIQTFNGIKNANNDWKKPAPNDKTLCAYVFRAADFRNQICHDNDVDKLEEATFEKKWKELKEILQGLKYLKSIDPLRTETLEFDKLECVIFEEFVDHLRSYKEECLNEPYQEDYVKRRFHADRNRNNIVIGSNIVIESDLENIITKNDIVMIYAEAGMGKSSTAKRIKKEWCNQNILKDFDLLFFDSKKMNKRLTVQSHAAPLYFSELGDYLKKNGRTENDLSIYSCVKTTIEKLIILIDGIDEFPIRYLVTGNYIDELERKVKNNEKINAADTIVAICFGFLLPNTNICLLGRNNEFERLKEFLSNNTNRGIKDLELLKFDDANVQEFTCLNICQQQSNGPRNCTSACIDIYEKIKDIELCKTPTDLNSLIKLHKKHPNENVGRITRTKLIIASLLNRLNEHINRKHYFPSATFGNIRKQKDFSKYLEGIRTLGEISFKSLLKNNITVQVEEEQDNINGIVHFNYENQISIERKAVEELDLFYIRDFDYYSILEPHHTLNVEYLCSCYLFSHPEEWESILELNKDRQLVIIKFIAGLHAGDYFTKDFVKNVLNISDYSLEQFFNWLYNVNDVRKSLPDGGYGYNHWFGLMETQKLSPSLFLLDSISQEVEIPQTFIPNTIVCYCDSYHSFEWYDMDYLKHNLLTKLSDKLNIESFLNKFPNFKFIIKGDIYILDNDDFNRLDQCGANNLITFRINELSIATPLNTSFSSPFKVNTLYIWECDSRTIDMMLNALSPPIIDNTSSKTPSIKCKRLDIDSITRFNSQQTEKLLQLGLSDVVDSISLRKSFFTDGQTAILEDVERKTYKEIDIQLYWVRFNRMFDLPELGSRHISLWGVEDVRDSDLIKFKECIRPRYSHNFSNYRIVDPDVPFVRKEKNSLDCEQSMFLNMYDVDLRQASPDVFANTFSSIPSLSCEDVDQYIPSSHWLRLAQTEDSQINEMRIWFPQPKNFEHFLNIKTNIIQFICSTRDGLKELLNHIVSNPNIHLDKEIKVFVVKVDYEDWDHYEEVTLFSEKTIEEYKNNYSSDNILLNNICVLFYEGERRLKWWCCEISLSQHERTVFIDYYDDDESSPTNDESNPIFLIDNAENQEGGNCSKIPLPLQDTNLIDHFNDDESSPNVTNDESNPIFLIDNAENQEDGNCSKIPLPLQERTSLIDHLNDECFVDETEDEIQIELSAIQIIGNVVHYKVVKKQQSMTEQVKTRFR